MTGIYMVSAQKPTAVTHSILGRVTSHNDLNLIICKSTLIEIYKVTAEGLKFIRQINIWGVVENLEIIKLKNEKKDNLLITTCKYDIMVLSCELSNDGQTIYDLTKLHGNFRDTVPRPSSIHMITCVDTNAINPLVAIKCYDGILKAISVSSDSKNLNMVTIKMDDLNVIDLKFMHGYDGQSTLGLICKEPNNKLNFKVYELDMNKEILNFSWKREINDNQAFIIPVPEPFGGILIVGTQAITYFNNINNEMIQKSPYFLSHGEITNFAQIDSNGQRFLLSNTIGQLFLMILTNEDVGMSSAGSSSRQTARISDIRFEVLGETVIAYSMTYIDNGVVFIGSKLGDSQLIKLIDKPNEYGSYVDILETYTNLGPILDMLIVDIEKQGQGQLITCSGGHRNGSLRIIRSGIGIHESANVDLPGVKALWPLKIFSGEFDDHLVLSFYGYTKILSFYGDEFEDVELEGFELNSQTLHTSNVCNNQLLQVTSTSILLIKSSRNEQQEAMIDDQMKSATGSCRLVAEWNIPKGELISIATSTQNECLLACRNQLFYFTIKNESLELIKSTTLEHEIACLDIYSFNNSNISDKSIKTTSDVCAVGLWSDISARILRIPDLEEIYVEQLKGDVIPRSILIESLEQITYLFVSLGDGSVISYVINRKKEDQESTTKNVAVELTERRKVVLGTQPTILKKFQSLKPSLSNNIFACSDRPSVISSTNQKLVYSSVNLKQVEFMCQLNAQTKMYENSLALLSAGTLRIGKMDSIQKLHIRSVPLNESVRRITYQSETQTFGIATFRLDLVNTLGETKPLLPSASTQCANLHLSKPSMLVQQQQQQQSDQPSTSSKQAGSSVDTLSLANTSNALASNNLSDTNFNLQSVHSFLILDQNTFEVLHAVQFQANEFVVSIISMSFDCDASNVYFIIGCCYINDDDPEPKNGRLVVLKYSNEGTQKLRHICDKEIKGAPYCMQKYSGKLLVSISNSIKLFDLNKEMQQLNQVAAYSDNVFITQFKCKNDFILIGDLMKSCAVLTYRSDSNTFELVAKDHTPIWLSSIEMIDDDNFLMSDSHTNVIALKKDSGQSNEEERKCLENSGCIHLGEQINVFKHGSLGMQQQANELIGQHFYGNILGGTVSGSIILFAQLSSILFKILNELQIRLAKYLTTAGKIPYDKWREYEAERRIEPSKNFIDGDLIESFLELSHAEAANLIKDFKVDNSNIGHSNEEFSVNYFNKLVEELSRLH